jgi:hypothetical protein
MTTVSWSSALIGASPFLVVLVLKLLLDLRLAQVAVKYLYWVPVRNWFREKPPQLRGTWELIWASGGAASFEKDVDRHGHTKLRQLGSFVYAEFYSQSVLYAFFGQIKDGYVVGDWYDVKDPHGYFGAFQVEIVTSKELRGSWLGHSKSSRAIRSDSLSWKRIDG